MAKKISKLTAKGPERAFLVGVELTGQGETLPIQDSLAELELLAQTAGLTVVGQIYQKIDRPNPKTFIGSGKVEEIIALSEETQANLIVFDEELSPRHQRELEELFGTNMRTLDRTALILDIFAQHANTREGALQVELAQYEYRLPRLTRAWTHLARQAGGGGGRAGGVGGVGLRGPGETQLEVDRREIRRRIIHLKKELEKVRAHRSRHRLRRKKTRQDVVAIVGYTNAGKSTLLNRISDADVLVGDNLFATLDPTTRRVWLPNLKEILCTDTVGFIQKLPTTLIAAFRATLEEISEADLLLHVVDITHINVHAHVKAVHQTLQEIGADHIPVLTVLNKIDRLGGQTPMEQMLKPYENSVAISALTGEGIQKLLETIGQILYERFEAIQVNMPYNEGGLINQFHQSGVVEQVEHRKEGVYIKGSIPGRLVAQYQKFTDRSEQPVVNP